MTREQRAIRLSVSLILAATLATPARAGDPTATRTSRPTRTPTPAVTPASTGAVITYVLTAESRFNLRFGTRPPSQSGPLTGIIEVIAPGSAADRAFDFEIRRLTLEGGRYRFTASAGMLQVRRRHGRVDMSIDAILRVEPIPVGGTADAADVEFKGGSTWVHFSRYPPRIHRLAITGPDRAPPYSFTLIISAEPET
jgi:hypothetical protein